MDAETLPRIFEQFYQGDTDRRARRRGLGLTLCKRIVEQHGGTISAESRPGEGQPLQRRAAGKGRKIHVKRLHGRGMFNVKFTFPCYVNIQIFIC